MPSIPNPHLSPPHFSNSILQNQNVNPIPNGAGQMVSLSLSMSVWISLALFLALFLSPAVQYYSQWHKCDPSRTVDL